MTIDLLIKGALTLNLEFLEWGKGTPFQQSVRIGYPATTLNASLGLDKCDSYDLFPFVPPLPRLQRDFQHFMERGSL